MYEENIFNTWDNGYFVRVAASAELASPAEAFIFAANIRESAKVVERNRRYRWVMSQIPAMNSVGQLLILRDEGEHYIEFFGDVEGLTPRQARRLARHIEHVAAEAEEALMKDRAAMRGALDEFWSTYYENQQFCV